MEAAMSLSHAVGRQLLTVRRKSGLLQEDVARSARGFGLGWTRATVAALETGKRNLTVEELALLPLILRAYAPFGYEAVIDSVEFIDLLPDGQDILISEGNTIKSSAIKKAVAGHAGEVRSREINTIARRQAAEAWERIRADLMVLDRIWPKAPPKAIRKAEQDSTNPAEIKAAQKLGVWVGAVALAAQKLWGRGLTAERDRRVGKVAIASADRRSVQARRGLVTRDLLVELESHLTQAGVVGNNEAGR